MSVDRRRFLQLGAGAAAVGVAGTVDGQFIQELGRERSATFRGDDPMPSAHRFRLGAMAVTVVNDGHFVLPAEGFAPELEEEVRNRYFAARHLPVDAIRLQLCPVLIDTGTERILVDTGMGPPPEVAPDSGWLTGGFHATGTTREAIDVVVLTHGHGDHYGGLVDPETGTTRFPNADVVIGRAELEFWTDLDVGSRNAGLADAYGGPEAFEAYVTATTGVLHAVRDRLRPLEHGQEIAPGIYGVDLPGHTAGHLGILAESEGERLLLVGDAITNVHVAFEHPRWRFLYDDFREPAARTRVQLLERAATEGPLIAGYHFPFPGVGRVFRDRDGYRWLPCVVG